MPSIGRKKKQAEKGIHCLGEKANHKEKQTMKIVNRGRGEWIPQSVQLELRKLACKASVNHEPRMGLQKIASLHEEESLIYLGHYFIINILYNH